MSIDRLAFQILAGSVSDHSASLPPVHCVVTSPPYFRKRIYGDDAKEIGGERLDDYIAALVEVFTSIPLVSWGSCWVNMGDTRVDGALSLVPERFVMAMCDAGWALVDSVIWAKVVDHQDGTTTGSCMIEPAVRRLNGNGYEHLYRFVKNSQVSKAWSDMCAVSLQRKEVGPPPIPYLPSELMDSESYIEGRRLHNVWRVKPGTSKKKHYAVYPRVLCERPIAMTCPMWVNPDGSPRCRITEKQVYDEGRRDVRIFGKHESLEESDRAFEKTGRSDTGRHYVPKKPVTVGWTDLQEGWSPGIVLDPFAGTGTTGEAALRLGRSFIGIDLYPRFADMSRERCAETLDFMRAENLDPFDLSR